MKILYVAKHSSGGNDDEGAIAHALTQLGHEVECIPEWNGRRAVKARGNDLLLFHKWTDAELLSNCKWVRKVFWYFDLVEYPDPTLENRNQTRQDWMFKILPLVDIGFCTDGDWVEKINNNPTVNIFDKYAGKLIWLPQGADERNIGIGVVGNQEITPILFTGIRKRGGIGRASFVEWMESRYKSTFKCVEKGIYGKDMANLIAASQIVVAPDHPATHRYWSNRVWNTLGYGGFLLHPYCSKLAELYENGKDIVYYTDRDEDLLYKIDQYLSKPKERGRIALSGMIKTATRHTYRHRCVELLRVVKERLGLE